MIALDIRPLVRMFAQIPAGRHSGVRKERIDAAFGLRRIEDELCLPVLLKNRVVVIHRNRAIGVVVRRGTNTEDSEVNAEGKDRNPKESQERADEDPPQFLAQIAGRWHGPDYMHDLCALTNKLCLS